MQKTDKKEQFKVETENDLNLQDVTLADVIDITFLQRFQDHFAKAVGVASITVDLQGTPITKPSNFTTFCMEYTRGSAIGNKRCMECDRAGGEESARTGKPTIYECHAGLVDFAAPIMLEGRQIASIIGGQVLTSVPDEAKYRKIAREIGVNDDDYMKALQKIRPVSREQVEAAADVLFDVANNMSKNGYQKRKLQGAAATLSDGISQISATMEELAASASTVSTTQLGLNSEIKNVNNVTGKIDEVIELIKDIADETRLLGLNAAIEAARAGEAGLGFGVVAHEIRKLSDESKQTVGKIKELTTIIKNSVDRTVAMGNETTSTVEQQAAAIEEVTASVEEINNLTEQLNHLATKK